MQRIFDLIARLRGPDGCPWDRAQSLDDVLSDLIEEAYELEWAGTHYGDAELLDEMGDVLFVLCFALAIKRETSPQFTLDAIAAHAHDKIYGRHPHVFGTEKADTPAESIVHWERVKAAERAKKNAGTLDGIAGNLPALRHAVKVQERAAGVGFDWDDVKPVIAKLREEIEELERALESGDREHIIHEMGDVIFSSANVCRFLKIDADEALQVSTSKFIKRFQTMEARIHADGKKLESMTLDEMDAYWNRVKTE
ncbi:MAG TPA: nucleoside triphosphate pyrophosphohydrolase [Candidatus Krumholzibacteria bacterium]